jgi:N-carbamoyl-L-amino-acid hydrolase
VTRVLDRLDEIYAIAQHRAGYSPEEDAAHALAAGWLREAGLEVSVDGAGNLHGRRGRAAVWSGSHLDSVPTAGRFDGALGVVAAIEAAERLPDAELGVVVFRQEETGPVGSRRLSELPDAFLELHIEQGPVLAHLGEPLGIVTAIAGQARGDVVFEGRADHAGTTPMPDRDDALL